ncbi:MAG: glycogen/starch/alpha-glucan phosphorylase [Clostridiales bacterium]|nr:MAG: glycogen/starch/alpha-glucan phosphorylase [Clostridiales bacterium]
MTAPEVEELWRKGYNPNFFVTAELKRLLDMLTSGILGSRFDDISKSLLTNSFGTADAYMTIADFESYRQAQEKVGKAYLDKDKFTDMSLVNIAKSRYFSRQTAR